MEIKNLNKSLEEIFQCKYIVPLYQRNYAWGEDEISQLLQDLYENFKKYRYNSSLNYFIGSLVILKRKDGFFEVIDGQQRLTTLSILLKILDLVQEPKLFYESRPEVESFFDSFYRNGNTKDVTFGPKVSHLVQAVDLLEESIINPDEKIKKTLRDLENREEFRQFIYKNVVIVRVEIPHDTDVASYFEIMNNRGEQLQKHEILKSNLMEKMKDSQGNYFKDQQDEFSKIWDACSQMDIQIQKLFYSDERKRYFGEDYLSIKTVNLKERLLSVSPSIGFTINNALENVSSATETRKIEDVDDSGKDQSIIDFPNFLMHILKLKYNTFTDNGSEIEIPLNEKDLINVYDSIKERIDPADFINDLLYYRTVFDRYIVKSTEDENDEDKYNWTLQKPYLYEYTRPDGKISKSLKYKNSFESVDRLIKSLSLLQVSFRNRKYKNWLQELLFFFSDKAKFGLASGEFQSKIDEIILGYFQANITETNYDEGVKVPHFLFNYIDYLYWIKNADEFKFTYRNSVEHHLPQSYKNEINEDLLDNLGNLCLVSKSSNSKMNNEHPTGKAAKDGKYYRNNLPPKQKRMYQITQERGKWGNREIEDHKKEITNLISQNPLIQS